MLDILKNTRGCRKGQGKTWKVNIATTYGNYTEILASAKTSSVSVVRYWHVQDIS